MLEVDNPNAPVAPNILDLLQLHPPRIVRCLDDHAE